MATTRQRRRRGKTPTAADQGFPPVYIGQGGKFKPGRDARAKADLFAAVLGVENKGRLHTFTKAEADKLIKARGWQGLLAKAKATADKRRPPRTRPRRRSGTPPQPEPHARFSAA
jgi:hypothetical protein